MLKQSADHSRWKAFATSALLLLCGVDLLAAPPDENDFALRPWGLKATLRQQPGLRPQGTLALEADDGTPSSQKRQKGVVRILEQFVSSGRVFLFTLTQHQWADDMIRALLRESTNGVPISVINASFSLSVVDPDGMARVVRAMNMSLRERPRFLVLAAGNGGIWMSCYQTHFLTSLYEMLDDDLKHLVIFVGATRKNLSGNEVIDGRYTNLPGRFGDRFIFAPSSFNDGKTMATSGTSFAAPYVSGLLARALMMRPDLSHKQIIETLYGTARLSSCVTTGLNDHEIYGQGIVNPTLFFRALRGQWRAPQKTLRPAISLRQRLDVLRLLLAYSERSSSMEFQAMTIMSDITAGDLMRVRLRLDDFPVLYSYYRQMRLDHSVFMNILLRYPEAIQTELILELLDAGYWRQAVDVIQVFPSKALRRAGRLNHQSLTVGEWAIRQANKGILNLLIRQNALTQDVLSASKDLNLSLMPHKRKARQHINRLLREEK